MWGHLATPISFAWDPQQTYSWPILAPSQNAGIWFWTFGSIQLTQPPSHSVVSHMNYMDQINVIHLQLLSCKNSWWHHSTLPKNISSPSNKTCVLTCFLYIILDLHPDFFSLRKVSSQVTNFHGLLFHLAQVLEEVEHLFAIPTAIQPGKTRVEEHISDLSKENLLENACCITGWVLHQLLQWKTYWTQLVRHFFYQLVLEVLGHVFLWIMRFPFLHRATLRFLRLTCKRSAEYTLKASARRKKNEQGRVKRWDW